MKYSYVSEKFIMSGIEVFWITVNIDIWQACTQCITDLWLFCSAGFWLLTIEYLGWVAGGFVCKVHITESSAVRYVVYF